MQWDLRVTESKNFYVNIVEDFSPYEVTVENIALIKQLEIP